jgi:hypothetical protein
MAVAPARRSGIAGSSQHRLRFAVGAAISVAAGLVGVLAGQRIGGVMLAAPADAG